MSQYIHINTDTGELRVFEEVRKGSVWTVFEVDDSYVLEIPLQVMHNTYYVMDHVMNDLSHVKLVYISPLTMTFDFPNESDQPEHGDKV